MKRTTLAVSAALFLTTFLATMAWAHEHQQHVMGMVTKVEGSSISVKGPDGAEKTVTVVEGTKFVKNGAAVTQKDVKVGDRVVIHAMPMGDMLHATEVKIGEATKEHAPDDQH